MVKNPLASAGAPTDVGLIPGCERSPGGGIGNPLQYSCLDNLMDREAWPWGRKESDTTKLTEHAYKVRVKKHKNEASYLRSYI